MSSLARREFIESLDALEGACDAANVRAQDATGRFLRKGLVVAAYNMFEGFLADRWSELAAFANTGHTQFGDLPESMQQKILERTVQGARAEFQRSTMTLQEKKDFSSRVGSSLMAVSSGLQLSDLVAKWQGSNVSSDEIAQILKIFRVESPWQSLRDMTSKFGYPALSGTGGVLDLESEFRELTRTRNEAAHVMGFNITSLQLRTVPTLISRVGFGVDVLLSAAVCKLQSGDQKYLRQSESVKVLSLDTFRVVERQRDYALFHQSHTRARRTDADGDALFNSACAAATLGQVVVRLNRQDQVRDWSVGGAG